MTEPVTIVFAIDQAYLAPLEVALTSLINHANPARNYQVLVLNRGLDAVAVQALTAMSTKNVQVQVESLADDLAQVIGQGQGQLKGEQDAITIYYRLFLPTILAKSDRAIYVDADILLRDDIAKLYDLPLNGNWVAASRDRVGAIYREIDPYIRTVLGIEPEAYFNSGVMVLDLAQLRANHFVDRFVAAYQAAKVTPVAPDQDYLNSLCAGHVQSLPLGWNASPLDDPLVDEPSLIHYCLFSKPWRDPEVAYSNQFWKVADQLPVAAGLREQIVTGEALKKQQERDAAMVQGLIGATQKAAQAGERLVENDG